MTKKRLRRVMALVMALVLTVGAVLPTAAYANATGPDADVAAGSDGDSQAEVDQEPVLYNETDRPDLEPAEIAAAEDIIVAAGYGFDVEQSFDGISYDDKTVKVSYYAKQGSFDGDKEGDYATYYKAELVSGKTPYLICRTISVREPETAVEESRESGSGQPETGEESSGEEEPAPGEESRHVSPSDGALEQEEPAYGEAGRQSLLSEGEMETFSAGDTMMIQMASAPVLKAAANPSSKDSMKVSCSGYAKYCGHSMGIKYISESGDYHNHLVYCLNLNKNTTNGTVGASSSKSSIKPEITYCMVNGARKLNGTCHNSKYSAGSASADYFITGASIHVLNGEVKLSYYNNGSNVYNKIAAMVSDAKNYDEDEYDEATGVTKSITYKISPKKTEWQDMGDGLYRSKEKFVRTKMGAITDVSYKITGQPNGLTVGELKTDASDIEDDSDLKKYDICVAQTDADKPSSNFYLYCNGEAMEKIVAADSTIKLTATAKSKEKGGRKWTPTVVSQQKITFLEEFEPGTVTASVKVTSKFKEGRFELHKTNVYNGDPVEGATYYLYEDEECTDLLCKLGKTGTDGRVLSGKETLTQGTYYLKEVKAAPGFLRDETVYPVGLEYFTLYDSDGKVTQQGKKMEVKEYPDKVGVMVTKTDAESGNFVKGAGFAVFTDAGCTNRVSVEGDGKTEVPVFYYDEDLDVAASEKFVKMQDKYYVKEVVIPDGYRDDGKVWEVAPDYGEISDFSAENTPIRCDVAARKEDKETGAEPQGDAKLSGATYGLYAAETIVYPDGRGTVTYAGNDNITSTQGTDFVSTGVPAEKDALLATVKTGEQAEFNFGNLYFGNYYIREIEASEGYLLDETIYPVNFREAQDTHHDISLNTKVVETVKKQAFEIIKVSTDGASTETDYVKGAEFTVKLQSDIDENGWDNAKTHDVLVTDEKGYALSKELPYGKYLVKETKVPKDLYKTKDFTVTVTEDSREPQQWRVFNDGPFKAYIRIVKKDAENGNTVLIPDVTFKIKNTDTDEYVEQKVGDKKISEFTTDETGTITTPLQLKYGNYAVEEITAPEGYVITEESYPLEVTTDGMLKVSEDIDGDPVIEVEIENKPVKGSISIKKSGEVLASIVYDTIVDRILSEITDENRSVDFGYEEQPLAGAVFNIVAVEDIYTPDHQTDEDGNRILEVIGGVPASKGAIVATLTTDEKGEASLDNLPLGKYQVVEVQPPSGFAICEEPIEVSISYEDEHTEVVYGEAGFVNARVKPELSLIKTDSVSTYPVAGATYGIYTKEDILSVTGEVLVKADDLVDTAVTDENGKAVFEGDLPLGLYYVKEVESPAGYLLDETVYDVDFSYTEEMVATPTVIKELEMKDTPIIVEVSKTDITTGKELPGATLEIIDSDGEVYASWKTDGKPYRLEAVPAGDYTLRETAAPYGYLIANEVDFTVEETGEIQKVAMTDERVKGKITLYKTCSKTKKPLKGVTFELRSKDGKKLETLVTDKTGYAETGLLDICTYNKDGSFKEDIPYYIVETKATEGYILDDTPHEVLLQYDDSATETVVYTLKLKNKPDKPGLPQTGGNYHPWMFAVLGGACIAGGVLYGRKRRKKRA